MPQNHATRPSLELDTIDPAPPPPTHEQPSFVTGPDQEKRKKRAKKWSIGGLFRRKKKASDSDSSSPVEHEEEKKGFLERRRAARKRRNRGSKDVTYSFEHVIINNPRNSRLEIASNEISKDERLSERTEEEKKKEPFSRRHSDVSNMRASSVSSESASRKGGGGRNKIKFRGEHKRGKVNAGSSSDEGGESSRQSTSSLQRMNNDDTLGSKDGSLSRRSRAARTERYKKRLSRDEEFLKDAQPSQHSRISRSDERISTKNTDKVPSGNRWTANVVYCESSDYDAKYTAKTKSATPSPIQSPKTRPKNALHYTSSAPSGSTYVTFPPSHARDVVARSHQELRNYYPQGAKSNQRYTDVTPPRLPKGNNDLIVKAHTSSSVPKNFSSRREDILNRKSASYDCNVNSLHHHHMNNFYNQTQVADDNVLVVKFPIPRPINKVETKPAKYAYRTVKHSNTPPPPPPPPRDPLRILVPLKENNEEKVPRPMSYAFEDRNHHNSSFPLFFEFKSSNSAFQKISQMPQVELKPHKFMNKQHRSNSDNHIADKVNSITTSPPVHRRPSSVHPEMSDLDAFANTPLDMESQNNYRYVADQLPRSRKPIHITYNQPKLPSDPYLSDSQVVVKPPLLQTYRARPLGVQNASDFWKNKDQESAKKVHLSESSPKCMQRHINLTEAAGRSRSNSPFPESNVVSARMKLPPLTMPLRGPDSSGSPCNQSLDKTNPRTITNKPIPHNEIGIPLVETELTNNPKKDFRPLSMVEEKHESTEQESSPRVKANKPPTPPTRRDSKINAVTNFECFDVLDEDFEIKEGRRKSSNLEEALNELEAIYKSLRLDEEGYIENIAKEKAVYENNRLDPSNWNAWVQSRGFESDSSFNYSKSSLESVDSLDSPIKRSRLRNVGAPDRVTDDMAYRRLNKTDRQPPHEQEVISQAGSFLLVSPTLSPPPFIEPPAVPAAKREPDITLDDVVYRNITHINNSLKVMDPQPPFGIPLGPIAPAPNSDYLHATPKESYRPTFKPRKTPDVVADDLAFRNLRKDSTKEPLFSAEDTTLIDSPALIKKRAVRSLSANLLSIIQKESLNMSNNRLLYNNNNIQNDLEKSQSFTDVTNANVVNGISTNSRKVEECKKRTVISLKESLNGEDSDATTRGSGTGASSPLVATSTETLTGSKSNVYFPELKQNSHTLSSSSSPRLSITPERRNTTDSFQIRKSVSPAKHVPIKLAVFKDSFSTNKSHQNSPDIERSPTPDSHTLTHDNDLKEGTTKVIYNQHESDLLAALAKEAKEASEQLSKELYDLGFEKDNKSKCHRSEEDVPRQKTHPTTESYPVNSKSLPIGKITPHKPITLNTFCITSNNKLENKQTLLLSSSGDIKGSKSMTDLLDELTKDLDVDFGSSPENTKPQEPQLHFERKLPPVEMTQNNDSTSVEVNATRAAALSLLDDGKTHSMTNVQLIQDKLSTPERVLLSSFPDEHFLDEPTAQSRKTSPANRFPLSIPDDSPDETGDDPCEEAKALLSQPPSGREFSTLADEGSNSARPCADPITLIVCMACAHQLVGLDFITVLGLILATVSIILFLII